MAKRFEIGFQRRTLARAAEVKAGAVILTAGESRRMGRPKAYLPFRGGTFLSVAAQTLGERCSPVIAVFGFNAETLREMAPAGITTVVNANYERGMLTSLQCGLRGLPADCETVFFTLVDHPAFELSTIEALLKTDALIAIPRTGGKRGHPVLIRRPIIDEFLAEPETSMVRDVIDRHAAAIQYVAVDDPGICDDIDDPELYVRLLARETAQG